MDENIQKEFEELKNLEVEGGLDDAQSVRLEELKKIETEKTGKESKDLQSALAQKEHFRTKFEKAEAEKNVLEIKLAKAGQNIPISADTLEIVKLGKSLSSYGEEETDLIITNAKGKFNTLNPTPDQIIQASKDEWVQTAIQARREKVANEKKIPGSTSTDFSSSEKKISKDTPKEDIDKILEERFKKSQESSKSV